MIEPMPSDSPNADSPTSEPPKSATLDEAFAAYLRGCDEGSLDCREAFLAQYPELSSQLKELMEAADMIGQWTSGGTSLHATSPKMLAGAETVALRTPDPDESGDGMAVTLPMSHRAEGDTGPTLPFDLGDYLLLEVIGRGGMGVVYLAKQKELDRLVAVKMIRSGMLAGEAEVRRFYTEAQAAARLDHPGIVSVHQFGQRAGHHFFSMEFVRGTDLQRKINNETLAVGEAARYVRDVARAIHHAHEKGVLHRDLKPANVLIDESDKVLVTDFGLAKHVDKDGGITGSHDAIGTPHYMAPEQAGGQSDQADVQCDVYALGAILFAALTGRPPIVRDTVMQTLVSVVHDPAPAVRSIRKDVPIDLQTVVAKCLEKQPGNRYASAEALADELDAFLESRPIQARPRSAVVRAWQWFEGVPMVGALTGRRVLHSSIHHRRFQAALLLLMLTTPIVAVGLATWWNQHKDQMPNSIRVAGGLEGGVYNDLSSKLATRVSQRHGIRAEVVASNGSLDNRARLLSYQIDVAPMQATAMSGDHVCVIAPLFYEILYVLAKKDSAIESIGELAGHAVAVGPEGSGSRATAEMVFDSLGLDETAVRRQVIAWDDLFEDSSLDAAMICIGRGSPLVTRLLERGEWRLVPLTEGIEISLQHPTLRPMSIEPTDHPKIDLPGNGIPTVGTTAFLAARDDTPADLVTAMLEALYQEPAPCIGLIPRRRAAEWQGLAFHPAARVFFSQP